MAQGLTTYTYPTIGEKKIFIMGTDYSSIDSGTFAFTNVTTQWFNGYFETTTGVVGDSINYLCYLNAGIYQLFVLSILGAARGIIRCSIDGTSLGTYDTYDASTRSNMLLDYPAFTITAPKVVTINFYATGKNAGSSDERMAITYIDIYQRGLL